MRWKGDDEGRAGATLTIKPPGVGAEVVRVERAKVVKGCIDDTGVRGPNRAAVVRVKDYHAPPRSRAVIVVHSHSCVYRSWSVHCSIVATMSHTIIVCIRVYV